MPRRRRSALSCSPATEAILFRFVTGIPARSQDILLASIVCRARRTALASADPKLHWRVLEDGTAETA